MIVTAECSLAVRNVRAHFELSVGRVQAGPIDNYVTEFAQGRQEYVETPSGKAMLQWGQLKATLIAWKGRRAMLWILVGNKIMTSILNNYMQLWNRQKGDANHVQAARAHM